MPGGRRTPRDVSNLRPALALGCIGQRPQVIRFDAFYKTSKNKQVALVSGVVHHAQGVVSAGRRLIVGGQELPLVCAMFTRQQQSTAFSFEASLASNISKGSATKQLLEETPRPRSLPVQAGRCPSISGCVPSLEGTEKPSRCHTKLCCRRQQPPIGQTNAVVLKTACNSLPHPPAADTPPAGAYCLLLSRPI